MGAEPISVKITQEYSRKNTTTPGSTNTEEAHGRSIKNQSFTLKRKKKKKPRKVKVRSGKRNTKTLKEGIIRD